MGKLWIRSQDKHILAKYNRLAVSQTTPKTQAQVMGFVGYDFGYETLGRYKTKERALEVLDEIQNLLFNKEIKIESLKVQQEKEYEKIKELIKNGTYHFIPESSVEYIEPSCIVYEMPKE